MSHPSSPSFSEITSHNKELLPDRDTLRGIFPDLADIPEDAYTVITNTFDTCTFRLQLSAAPRSGYPTNLVIRLEKTDENIRLQAVTELQNLARLQLPDLVPETLAVGSTTNASGTDLNFTVTPFLEGTVDLEDIWSDLEPENQQALMDAVVDAVKRLQQVDSQSTGARRFLEFARRRKASSGEVFVGGPYVGYHSGIKSLLNYFHGPMVQACEISSTDGGGWSISSAYQDGGSIELSQVDLDFLEKSAVLCHNDLEPRNILVRQTKGEQTGSPWFEIAAIIDWEMAGFYPFSWEFGLKDTILGLSSLHLGWYSLFKERAASLVPGGDAHDKLIKALGIIVASKEEWMDRNVGVRFRGKWIERQRLGMSEDVRRGWVREDEDAPIFNKEDSSNLELEVLKELGHV